MINYEEVVSIALISIILGSLVTHLQAKETDNLLPIKLNIELKRNYNFLKLLVSVKNMSSESQHLNLKLTVYKKNSLNISRIVQTKELYLKSQEFSLPFITEFAINAQDIFEIKIQVFDLEGNLLMEKIWESSGV